MLAKRTKKVRTKVPTEIYLSRVPADIDGSLAVCAADFLFFPAKK